MADTAPVHPLAETGGIDPLLAAPLPPRDTSLFTGADLRLFGFCLVLFGMLCNIAAAALAGVQIDLSAFAGLAG
jgi:hypothetical protein